MIGVAYAYYVMWGVILIGTNTGIILIGTNTSIYFDWYKYRYLFRLEQTPAFVFVGFVPVSVFVFVGFCTWPDGCSPTYPQHNPTPTPSRNPDPAPPLTKSIPPPPLTLPVKRQKKDQQRSKKSPGCFRMFCL